MWYRVFSTGHAGSTWLSTVLHHPHRGAPAFHEPMPVLLPREFRTQCGFDDLTDPEARASFLAHVEPYLAWWRRRIQRHDVVGEVHAFGWWIWPHLPQHAAPRRCLVVRNGIQVVHSMSRTLRLWTFPESAFASVLGESSRAVAVDDRPAPARSRSDLQAPRPTRGSPRAWLAGWPRAGVGPHAAEPTGPWWSLRRVRRRGRLRAQSLEPSPRIVEQ